MGFKGIVRFNFLIEVLSVLFNFKCIGKHEYICQNMIQPEVFFSQSIFSFYPVYLYKLFLPFVRWICWSRTQHYLFLFNRLSNPIYTRLVTVVRDTRAYISAVSAVRWPSKNLTILPLKPIE